MIFDLPAVVQFDRISVRQCLIDAVQDQLQTKLVLDDVNWSLNCRGVMLQVLQNTVHRTPTEDEYSSIKKAFNKCLKRYYLDTDDYFDVWPGVQNIFESLQKKKKWDFAIISDYWEKGTRFILDSCGIYSKGMKLFTAEYGTSSGDILHLMKQQWNIKPDDNVYVVSSSKDLRKLAREILKGDAVKMPYNSKEDHLKYPRFSKLFEKVKN